MKLGWKLVVSLRGALIDGYISPFPEGGLYKPFGFPVGSRGVGSDTDMADVKIGAEIAENLGGVAGSVVHHDAFNGDPEVLIVGDRGQEESSRASGGFAKHYSGESHAGIVVDADVQVFPPCVTASVHANVPSGSSTGYESPSPVGQFRVQSNSP